MINSDNVLFLNFSWLAQASTGVGTAWRWHCRAAKGAQWHAGMGICVFINAFRALK